jgi:hypothetical protein
MPCPQCQKHYREWLRKHPSAQFQNLEGTTLRDVARKWLWELHNEVNQRNGVAALPFDDVALLYKDTTPADFRQLLGLVTEKVGVKGEPLRKFRKCFLLLLKLINKV